jgi:glutamate/tyrosine decarboxylase-like PLP-dependent enzyme
MNGDAAIDQWMRQWGEFQTDPSLVVPDEHAETILERVAERLRDNYPFPHPVYAGQMLKPPHAIAQAAYALAMQINPNNHALDGGPATAAMERETIRALANMVGYDPEAALGHLTSSGTIANLEALWIGRELAPGKAVASSAGAHYTHSRMCGVLGIPHVLIPTDRYGRMDCTALGHALADGSIGTVVATLGTTSLGAIDDLPCILDLARSVGTRVHVDAAYGGFFRLLTETGLLSNHGASAFRGMADADSIVIDPHKHGLQPYGCGSVLFHDPTVGQFYKHDSPYTYFTSDDLHLGEISLECSRAGASAAALWATLQAFPLTPEGLGRILARTRTAAMDFARLLGTSGQFRLVTDPELDIVCFYPVDDAPLPVSEISMWSEQIFEAGMRPTPDAFFLAKLTMSEAELPAAGHPGLVWDAPRITVLRSVLMKPEHADFAPELVARIVAGARSSEPIQSQRG